MTSLPFPFPVVRWDQDRIVLIDQTRLPDAVVWRHCGDIPSLCEAIRELAASVETELEPIVIQVEGQTLRLSGTAETQYEEWRRLLQEIWITETGLPQDPNEPVSSNTEKADSVPNRQPQELR